jgi:hypothetical protein
MIFEKIKRNGQEEMVGFVVIVVIMAVVVLVFLGIGLRNSSGGVKSESVDVSHFLESSMEYTTNCSLRFEGDYADLGEMFRACNDGKKCLDELESCEVLEEEFQEILEASWKVGEDRPIKSYSFRSLYQNKDSPDKEILVLGGNCSGSSRGASNLISDSPGKIVNSLELCY